MSRIARLKEDLLCKYPLNLIVTRLSNIHYFLGFYDRGKTLLNTPEKVRFPATFKIWNKPQNMYLTPK